MTPKEQNEELFKLEGWRQMTVKELPNGEAVYETFWWWGPKDPETADEVNRKAEIAPKDYLNDENAMRNLELFLGLGDRENRELRVKWVNKLRDIVSRSPRIPKNKVGTALVSDVDLMFATLPERAETILQIFKKWPK